MCFLGYSLNHKGYLCLDLTTHRIYISRHVLFYELRFPYHSLYSSLSQHITSTVSPSTTPSSLTFHHFPSNPAPISNLNTSIPLTSASSSSHIFTLDFVPTSNPATISPSSSQTHLPVNNHPMQTQSKSGIFKPKALIATKHHLPSHLTIDYVPKT